MNRIRHMATQAINPTDSIDTTQTNELLHRAVAAQVGPRKAGVVYRNIDGDFKVLDVITDQSEARRILKRRSAQFAVVIIDTLRPDAQPFAVGSTWTGSDRVLKAVA